MTIVPAVHRAGRVAATALADILGYARLAWQLRDFYRNPVSLEEARATVARRLADRESSFLHTVERCVFGHPESPYLALLKLAGCELADLTESVRAQGLERTLQRLRGAGVYVTYEEFKGRQPIVRHGQTCDVTPGAFNNPLLRVAYHGQTGGSTGPGIPVPISLERLASDTPLTMLLLEAHDLLEAPCVLWRGALPDSTGLNVALRIARFGRHPARWFSPVTGGSADPLVTKRFATDVVVLLARLWGARIPRPEPLPLDRAWVVARYIATMLRRRGACLVFAPVSLALRVSAAAQQEGLDLTGAAFLGGGEPPTPEKVRVITRSGARWIPNYAFSEVGTVGLGCARPVDENDTHLRTDGFALIEHPRDLPSVGLSVNAFHFTTLLPSAPKILLNVETDDYGVVETRSCGCPLGSHGLTTHIRDVRSFAKITSEGEALLSSDMIRVVEDVFPARFGGTPLDYQLIEEQDGEGFTRMTIVVSPRIGLSDESLVIDALLAALPDRAARAVWRQAGTVRVRRMEPLTTARGKSMPLVPRGLASRLELPGRIL